jgi:hypothetical protein
MGDLTILAGTMSSSESPSPSSSHSSDWATECSSNSSLQKRLSTDFHTEPSVIDYSNTSWLDLTPDEPFNFLGLPKEIRLMIYELLPQKILHRFAIPDCVVEVTDKCCNPALLSTCRLIHDEAHQLIFNALIHDGPRLHLTLRGLDVDHLLLVCDRLSPNRPLEQCNYPDPSDVRVRQTPSPDCTFDFNLFELRSYMRTPKDYQAHIDWFPSHHDGLRARLFLGRFLWVLGRLYCIVANQHDYTVSVWDGEFMVPILDFMNKRIPRGGVCGTRFHEKLARDGFSTWRDIICRPQQRSVTTDWLWRHR